MKRRKTKSRLPFHRQERPYSCVNACLRMILEYHGIEINERNLRDKCHTTELGTYADDIISCLEHYGFRVRLLELDLMELRRYIKEDIFPVLYINLYPLYGKHSNHAVIVEGVDERKVLFLDPLRGITELESDLFSKCWNSAGNLGIIIERNS